MCTKIKKDYRQLAKVTFVRLITVNDQRGGKRSKLQLVDWEGAKDDYGNVELILQR